MAEASVKKLKVFISYSRKDLADFADELVAGLGLAGFAPFLDRHDISAGEEWEKRLGDLIEKSDTVVFVVSPEAVKSERCIWEIDKASAQSKRLLPVIHKAVPEADIPEQLGRLQFVRFDTGPGLARPLTQLAEALRQDLDWVREHTRIGELASRWQARGKSDSLLLRGDELDTAKAWAANRKPTAPEMTEAQRALLDASDVAEKARIGKEHSQLEDMRRSLEATARNQKRTRRLIALVVLLLVGTIAGLVGWINQSYLKGQWRWYTTVRPFMQATVRPYVLSAAAEQALKPKDTFRECAAEQGKDYCPQMTVVPAGTFMMGSPASEAGHNPTEMPQHKVTIANPFAVSKFEITFDEWDTCVVYGDCRQDIDDSGFGRGQQPVIGVNLIDAESYVAWLSKMTGKQYRLLSEAEYEYAARAGTQTAYPWGDEIGARNANCDRCGSPLGGIQTMPVASFAPNAFGLHNMVGNVWVWTSDCVHDNYQGAPEDGSAWVEGGNCNGRQVRAGSWPDSPLALRSAQRNAFVTGRHGNALGLRMGRTLSIVPNHN